MARPRPAATLDASFKGSAMSFAAAAVCRIFSSAASSPCLPTISIATVIWSRDCNFSNLLMTSCSSLLIAARSDLACCRPPRSETNFMSFDVIFEIASRSSDTLAKPVPVTLMSICRLPRDARRVFSPSMSLKAPSKPLKDNFIEAAAWSARSIFWSGV